MTLPVQPRSFALFFSHGWGVRVLAWGVEGEAEQYGASRNTVRDAIKWLVNEGLIETRPGQGTFVAEKINPFVTKLSIAPQAGDDDCVYLSDSGPEPELKPPRAKPPRIEILRAEGIVASELQLDETAHIVSRRQERLIDDRPYSLHTGY